MNKLQIFEDKTFGKIRVLIDKDTVWFLGKDVGLALWYKNPTVAIQNHVSEADKILGQRDVTPYMEDSRGRKQYPTWINQSGLHSLVAFSKRPKAQELERWILDAALPASHDGEQKRQDLVPQAEPQAALASPLDVISVSGIRGYEKDGTVYLNLEDVARGLGLTTVATSGNEIIRWARVKKYLAEFGFGTYAENSVPTSGDEITPSLEQDNLPEYIPESVFYRLAMKAKNEAAERFQALIAEEIIPTIRRTGGYVMDDALFAETYMPTASPAERELFRMTLAHVRKQNEQIVQMQNTITHLEPDAEYCKKVLQAEGLVSIAEIAKDFGFRSAQQLNKILSDLGIQYKVNGAWVLYRQYADLGLAQSKTFLYGKQKYARTFRHLYWTQRGVRFIYDLLKSNNLLPQEPAQMMLLKAETLPA